MVVGYFWLSVGRKILEVHRAGKNKARPQETERGENAVYLGLCRFLLIGFFTSEIPNWRDRHVFLLCSSLMADTGSVMDSAVTTGIDYK